MWLVEGIRSLKPRISQILAEDVTNAEPVGRGETGLAWIRSNATLFSWAEAHYAPCAMPCLRMSR